MKRSTSFSSGMHNHQYSTKKKAWKWTPAKIAAFTMFGVMMAALAYFESSSGKTSNMLAPSRDQSSSVSPPSDFDKEYQEFLKKGEKLVSQRTLDSLNAIQNAAAAQIQKDPEVSAPSNNIRSEREVSVSPSSANSTTASAPNNIENNLESVDFIPPSSAGASNSSNQDITGTLQEATPNQYQTTVSNLDRSTNNQADQAITEEFYVEETVTGRVAAISNGVPLEGVKITVEGTTNVVKSDKDGQYSIVVPGDPAHRTIQYSYQGRYTERDITPGTGELNILF